MINIIINKMITRSITNQTKSFTKDTHGHCVVYQIEHNTSICLKKHDLDDLWKKYLLLYENRTTYNLESMKDGVFELWKSKDHKTPIHITDVKDNYSLIYECLKKGDIIEDIAESGFGADGVYLFDGTNIISTDRSSYVYGLIPDVLVLSNLFYPGYWDDPMFVVDEFLNGSYKKFYWRYLL